MCRYFISGHRNITEEEFIEHYTPQIDISIKNGDSFVVGDCEGVDAKAMQYIWEKGYNNLTVYYIGITARHNPGFKSVNQWVDGSIIDSDYKRDILMSLNSDQDIAWIRTGKERSGTARNLQRRLWLKEFFKNNPCFLVTRLLQQIEIAEANIFI